jgi:hypothetical protein
MAEQAKRGPGRPKKSVTTTVEAPVVEAPTLAPAREFVSVAPPPIVRREKAVENRVYTIPSGGGIVYMIQSKGVTIYDEEKNRVREMRYCPNEPSIWVDEQSENAMKKPVIFDNGNLIVTKDKPNLMEYLDRHPQNISNGGGVFKLIDQDRDAEMELKKEFSTVESVSMVRDKPIQELLPVALFYGMSVDRPVAEIRFDLLKEAKGNPEKFIQAFDNPVVQARAVVYQAKEYQIINIKNDGAYWFDSNRLIVANPTGQDCIDTLTRYCLTDKGASVFSKLRDDLMRLA